MSHNIIKAGIKDGWIKKGDNLIKKYANKNSD
jgi:hypothetical protein